jgi:hypothetical protein
MPPDITLYLLLAFFVVAALYTTVGHAGASGYLATMALLGLAPDVIRPTALVLNIVAAALAVMRFRRAGFLSWPGLWPFLIGSVPCAVLGGATRLADRSYYAILGLILLIAASIILWRALNPNYSRLDEHVRIPMVPAIFIGAIIGLLSGLTGTGGGIFLSPVLLMMGWAGPKSTGGIAAPFIFLNSVAALLAGSLTAQLLPTELPIFVVAVILGAMLGTWLGLYRMHQRGLLTMLALVMSIAAVKLLATA